MRHWILLNDVRVKIESWEQLQATLMLFCAADYEEDEEWNMQ